MQRVKRMLAVMLAFLMVISTCHTEILAETITENTVAAEEEPVKALLNYLVVQEPMVTTPGTQTIMLGIGDGSMAPQAVVLSYQNTSTGETYQVEAREILDDFVMFEMEYPDDSWNGIYQLHDISYTIAGSTYTSTFAEMGIDASFGINQVADSTPDDVLLTEEEAEAFAAETDISIVSLDEDGHITSEENFEEALEAAGCEADLPGTAIPNSRKGAQIGPYGMKSLVVVLDAGHGGTDPGAQANGVTEKIVNLKIAQYCKAELEEYSGVVVHMTRSDDTYLSLAQRAQVAVDKKADVFISLHNNSSTSSVPCGANVYYPNSNYNANCGVTGKGLASSIESKLTDLGLASGGVHIRNTENGTKYPDGSLADYYGVIKRCKENGIPGLIVEHAFISNASDAKNYLSTDEQLKKLGIADATGIAEYYGLSKGLGFNNVQSKSGTTMELSWTQVVGVTGYCIARSTSSGEGFEEVAKIESASTTTWKDTGLTPGKTYYYKIRTYTKSGDGIKYGKYSPVASGTTIESPSISSIKSQSSTKLLISWTTVNSAANYEIYRATKEDGKYKKIATVAGINRVNYTDEKVKAGKLYYYKIRSIGQESNTTIYSDYSEIVSARTAKIPEGLSIVSSASDTLKLSWTGDENASGYIIKRATSANGKYKKIATIEGAEKNTYKDSGVTENKNYYYRIQSFNHNDGVKGYSGYGKAVSAKTLKSTSITKIVNNSSKKQTITWKKVDGVNGYVIYSCTSKNGTYKKLKTITSGNTTSYQVSKLTPGTRYYYKVRTRNKTKGKTEYGSYSKVRSAYAAEKAEIAAVTGSTGTKIEISWNPVNGAESYDIYRSDSAKGTFKKIGSVKGSEKKYIDKKLKMTKKYYYKIEAHVKGYKSSNATGLSAAVSGYPVKTTTIRSVSTNGQGALEVIWDKVKGIKGYRVYRSTEASGTYQLISTISDYKTAKYLDADVAAGTTYYYRVALMNKYDGKTIYGKKSAAVSGILLNAPQTINIVPVAENQLDMVWSPVAGAAGYVVYRSTELNGIYTEIGRVTSAETTFSDTSVTQGMTYYYKLKSIDSYGKLSDFSSAALGCAVARLVISGVNWSEDHTHIQITWNPSAAAVTGYEVYKSSASDSSKQVMVAQTTNLICLDYDVNSAETYYYKVRPYTEVVINGVKNLQYGAFSDTVSTNSVDYRIMGNAEVTVDQMVAMYQDAKKMYPAEIYQGKGAATIQEFCNIVYEESCVEGVKPEVIFAQICHETAYLQFGGQVKAEQCNFAGLGALDGGNAGETFADVRTGVRAQVQHLKAYASTEPLKQDCIDVRFSYIKRGTAEYVQQLGNGNWATDPRYAAKLMTYINKIKGK